VRWCHNLTTFSRLLPALLLIFVVSQAAAAQVSVVGVVQVVGAPNVSGGSTDFNPYTKIWAFVPSSLDSSDNMYFVYDVMPVPAVAGVSTSMSWSSIETTQPSTTPCATSDTCQPDPMVPGMYHTYDFTDFDASISQWFSPFGGTLKKVNLLIAGESTGATNAYTPHYVTSSWWYDFFSPARQDVVNNIIDNSYCPSVPWAGTDPGPGFYTYVSNTVTVDSPDCCSTMPIQSNLIQIGDLVWVSSADPNIETPPGGSTVTAVTAGSFTYTSVMTPMSSTDDLTFISAAQSWAVPYESPYMSALKAFWAAVVAHYGPSYEYFSQLNYFRFGGSANSEWYPYCISALEALASPYKYVMGSGMANTSVGWLNDYYMGMGLYLQSLDPALKIIHAINSANIPVNYTYAHDEAAIAVTFSNRFGIRDGFGSQGLSAQDEYYCTTYGCGFGSSYPSASDWYPLFNEYSPSGVPLELQPESISFPGDTTCQPPMQSCGVGDGNYSGDLPTFLYPFATSNGATDVEIYWRDLELAYDGGNYCQLPMAGTCHSLPAGSCVAPPASISTDNQLLSRNQQLCFFQDVGQGQVPPPPSCIGTPQTGATGNCSYATAINAAAGPH
jgi:hypothetical protein